MSVPSVDAIFTPPAGAKARPAAVALATSFRTALADASKANAETGTVDTGAPKNEKTKAVAGHSYADILNGPRRHEYVNTSGNARDGQTFKILHRDGRELHVYGEGKDRVVVALKKPSAVTTGSFVANG
jgi:hypothetical protein